MRTLVRQALRMRPDRLVVGEVRGAEVVDLLAALNTGHEGGCGTLHANSAADVPARVEALALAAGLGREAAHSQLAAAVDVVVHLARGRDGAAGCARSAVPERAARRSGGDGRRRRVDAGGRVRARGRVPRRSPRGCAVSWLAVGCAVARRRAAGPTAGAAAAGGSRRWCARQVDLVLRRLPAVLAARRSGAGLLVLVVRRCPAPAPGALWRRRRRATGSRRRSATQVLETCELLAAELAAGRPPGAVPRPRGHGVAAAGAGRRGVPGRRRRARRAARRWPAARRGRATCAWWPRPGRSRTAPGRGSPRPSTGSPSRCARPARPGGWSRASWPRPGRRPGWWPDCRCWRWRWARAPAATRGASCSAPRRAGLPGARARLRLAGLWWIEAIARGAEEAA